MRIKPDSKASGGGLFVKMLVGTLLTLVTFGIYAPWFNVSIIKYLAETITIPHPNGGDWKFGFEGTGLQLLGKILIGGLLLILTLGIYTPWFIIDVTSWLADNTKVIAPDGSARALKFDGKGGEAFMVFFVGGILSYLTLGLYAPWMACRVHRFWADHIKVMDHGEEIGSFEFVGNGEALFVKFIVGILLTIVTFGIYSPWFQVTLWKFFAQHSTFKESGRSWSMEFTSSGTDFFMKILLGTILTIITFGIYGAWYVADLIRFRVNSMALSTPSID